MSESVSVSAPTTTSEAAEQVIDAFESTPESSPEPETPAGDPAGTPDPAPVTPEPMTLGEVEELLHAEGFTDPKRPDGRENRIPYSKVKRIIENGLKKGRTEWDSKYTTVEQEAQTLRGQMEQLRTALQGDPRAFMAELATADPRFQTFLEPPAAPAVDPAQTMPPPDLQLGDGSVTYSLEGIQNLLDWKAAQLEAKVEARFKPIAEREAQERRRAAQAEMREQIQAKSASTLQDAQSWPYFGKMPEDGSLTPFQSEVLETMRADTTAAQGRRPLMSLHEAYIKVVSKRISEDDQTRRARILDEIKQAPTGTAVSRAGGETAKLPAGASTQDVAARTLARLERGGA